MTRVINNEMVSEYFSKLGKKGAKARAESLSPARRKEIAINAINSRWKKNRSKLK